MTTQAFARSSSITAMPPAKAGTTLTSIQKLQNVLLQIEESTQRARTYMRSADHLTAGRALVALGLCQQAREQVRAACQNMGFSMLSLLGIDETGTTAHAEEQRRQLKAARNAIVELLMQKMGVSHEAIYISIQAFAEESAIVAGMMVSRANRHLNAAVR